MQTEHIFKILNVWWKDANAPRAVFLARVVSIFKKGSSDDPANYRPISILSAIYNIYMYLIKDGLQFILEDRLCLTQYGFRPGRSTTHAINLTRRLNQIYAESMWGNQTSKSSQLVIGNAARYHLIFCFGDVCN